MKKIIFAAGFIFLVTSFLTHKYYHSHCSFELNPETGTTEVVLDVFYHDLEAALSKKNNKKITVDDKGLAVYVREYLKENFILKDTAGNVIDFDNYVGAEIKNDELSIYFEYYGLKSFAGLSLTNSILVREFPLQVNKVNVKIADKKKSLVYTKKIITQKISPL